jgi:hypothetical protein
MNETPTSISIEILFHFVKQVYVLPIRLLAKIQLAKREMPKLLYNAETAKMPKCQNCRNCQNYLASFGIVLA